jgi:hypothetical protein
MLNIYFGDYKGEVNNPSAVFDIIFEPEWFEDDLVKQMILDVDKTIVHSPYNLESKVLGQIGPSWLSGGVKALMIAYKGKTVDGDDFVINASKCGDNCAKWILEIAKRKKLTISLHNIMDFQVDFNARILNNNRYIRTYKQYVHVAVDYFSGGLR